MTDINGAHVTELAVRLQKFFANQAQVSERILQNLDGVIQDTRELETAWAAQGSAHHAQHLNALVEQLMPIGFACASVRDTAPLAEQDLLELLALVGVELGEHVCLPMSS